MNSEKNLLSRIATAFIGNYKATLILIVAIVIAGTWGVLTNQRQDFPPVAANIVRVDIEYIGANASDIEQQAVIPLENAINNVEGLSDINSRASDNFGSILVEIANFDELNAVTEEIDQVVADTRVPEDVETNVELLEPVGSSATYALTSNSLTRAEILEQAGDIAGELEAASNDVQSVEIVPNDTFIIDIQLNEEALDDNAITADQVVSTLQSYTATLPGGTITTDDNRTQAIAITASVDSLKDIRELAITPQQTAPTGFGVPTAAPEPVELSEVATVKYVPQQTDILTLAGYIDENGETLSQNAVYLNVFKTDNGDVIRMSEELAATVESLSEELTAEDIQLVELYNTAPSVERQINALVENAAIGLLLILVVLLLFINLRTAILVSFIIPLSFGVTLFILPNIGFSINILTTFGMILALGVLVDNAIVIAEGIVERLEHGKKKLDAIIGTIHDIGPAVITATLTTIIAFVPFTMTGGVIGEFLKYIPYTVIILLTASVLLALFVTPVLARFIVKETDGDGLDAKIRWWEYATVLPAVARVGQRMIRAVERAYSHVAKTILKRVSLQILVAVVALAGIVVSFGVVAPTLEFEQFPSNDSEIIQVTATFPTGTPYEEQVEVYEEVLDEAVTLPHFKSYFNNQGLFFVVFEEPRNREDGMSISEINDLYAERVASIEATLPDEIDLTTAAAGAGPGTSEFDVTVQFLSTDNDSLEAATTDLEEYIDTLGVKRINNSLVDELVEQVEVNFDEEALEEENVNPLLASQTINSVFSQSTAGSIVLNGAEESTDVIVTFDEDSTNTVDDLRSLSISTLTGETVELQDVARVESVQKASSLRRLNGFPVAKIEVIAGDDYTAEMQDGVELTLQQTVENYLTDEQLEEYGLTSENIIYGGAIAEESDSFNDLIIVTILAMLFVYIALVALFRSYGQPMLVMITVPLALIGVFPGLKLVGSSLNMISGLGVVALIGVVVNDAIVLIDYFNRYRRNNPKANLADSLRATGTARFKPILSTSITTIGGILPLTLTDPFWSGLGTSIISGLIFSTLGTLLVLPVVISLLYKLRKKHRTT